MCQNDTLYLGWHIKASVNIWFQSTNCPMDSSKKKCVNGDDHRND